MARRRPAAVACLLASALPACGSPGFEGGDAPVLEFRPEVGAVHRYRRVFDIRSEVSPRDVPEGKSGVHLRIGSEVTCRVEERTAAGRTILEVSVDAATFAMESPAMTFEVDSRRPETWTNLPGGHPLGGGGKDLDAFRRTLVRFEVAPDGTAVARREFEVAEDGRSRKERTRSGSLPGGGWPFGTLPCGSLAGGPGVGSRADFAMTLPFGPPGGPSVRDFPGRGSWTTAAWDPVSGEAALALEGEFPPAAEGAPAGSPAAAGTVSGEAVWSRSLGVVRRSLTLWEVTLREPGPGGGEVRMTARTEETLLE